MNVRLGSEKLCFQALRKKPQTPKIMLMTLRCFIAILLSWLTAGLAVAAPITESDFHANVDSIYDFAPHSLKKDEMQAKSKKLDKFWTLVKNDPKNTLPLLRKEMALESQVKFFYYDANMLLLSLSEDKADQSLALRTIAKTDLRDINPTDYLDEIHWFASKGFDTRECAFKILAMPNFNAFITKHTLMLGQDYSLIYMLFPMKESIFVPDLVKHLSEETNEQSMKSLLLALWYSATPDGISAINAFINNPKSPEEPKTYAKELLAKRGSALSAIDATTSDTLREKRRTVMQAPISNEGLDEFGAITDKLIAKK